LFKIGGSSDRKFSGYKDCYLICPATGGESPFLGWVGVSGASDNMRGWWCFSLPGKATENVINWSALVSDMWDMRGRITRVDLALDDMDGVHPLLECEALYDAGAFQSNKGGRPPSAHTRKCKLGLSGDTLYVGSRDSGKQMRCYEKGKQLGDSDSPWVRYEGELLRKDKNIPWDVLLFPAQYLKGMYETAFAWMPASPIHLAALKEKARITLERAKKWLKQQGGRLICYLREVVDMDVADIVCELSAPSGLYPLRLFDAARHAELAWPD
jgi:phage replication initiation protein